MCITEQKRRHPQDGSAVSARARAMRLAVFAREARQPADAVCEEQLEGCSQWSAFTMHAILHEYPIFCEAARQALCLV